MFSFQKKRTQISPTKLTIKNIRNSQLVIYLENTKKNNSEHMHSAISTASHFNTYMINIIGSHNLSYYHIAHMSALHTHLILPSIFKIASSIAGTLSLKIDHCSEGKLIPKIIYRKGDMFSFKIQINQVLSETESPSSQQNRAT